MPFPGTAMIELFVRSRTLEVVPAVAATVEEEDDESPGGALAVPSARRLRFLPQAHQDAVDRLTALAGALREELVVWDVATARGRRAAHRKGVRTTPAVLHGLEKPESVAAFTRTARAALATIETSES